MLFNLMNKTVVPLLLFVPILLLFQGCFSDAGDPAFLSRPLERYMVTFEGGGADTNAIPGTMTVTRPALALSNLPSVPVLAGFSFGGWFTGVNGTGSRLTVDTVISSNLRVYPCWTSTLCFDSMGGTTVTALSHAGSNWLSSKPEDPEKTGSDFTGWYLDSACTIPWDFTTDYISSNTTLYAGWSASSYTVSYYCADSTNGTVPPITNYLPGETVVVSANVGNLICDQNGIPSLNLFWATNYDGTAPDLEPGNGSFVMPSNNIVLYARWDALGATGPGGGTVYHDKGYYSDGWRYLEAAPDTWGYQYPTTASKVIYFGPADTETGVTDQEIGTGLANTQALIALLTNGTKYAAHKCNEYSSNGKSDWFLPSFNELKKMYQNRTYLTGLVNKLYISSSEYDVSDFMYVNESTGLSSHSSKIYGYTVIRPVRRF